MEYGKQPAGMWETPDGTDCSMLPRFDWQKNGFRMQPTLVEQVRGVDDENDNGYAPEAEVRVRQFMNAPFTDNAVDPSMMEERSNNLRDHVGEFWEGNSEQANDVQAPEAETAKKKGLRIPARTLRNLIFALLGLIALLTGLRLFVFNVSRIEVIGTSDKVMQSEIRTVAGVQRGANILTLNDDAIASRIGQMRYVQLDAVEKVLPHTVRYHVRIREQSTYILHCGIIYILDNRGMVLEECSLGDVVPDYPQVTGLQIDYCAVGSQLQLRDASQLSVYTEFARELTIMKMTDMVREIYLNDTSSIYLGTDNGFSVRMGDDSRIHAKLRALQLVMEFLEKEGRPVGTIDVSNPESPTYIPTSTL